MPVMSKFPDSKKAVKTSASKVDVGKAGASKLKVGKIASFKVGAKASSSKVSKEAPYAVSFKTDQAVPLTSEERMDAIAENANAFANLPSNVDTIAETMMEKMEEIGDGLLKAIVEKMEGPHEEGDAATERIDAIVERMDSLVEKIEAGETSGFKEGVAKFQEEVKEQLTALNEKCKTNAGIVAAVESLSGNLNRIEGKLIGMSGSIGKIDTLHSRLDEMEERATTRSNEGRERIDRKIDDLTATIRRYFTRLGDFLNRALGYGAEVEEGASQ